VDPPFNKEHSYVLPGRDGSSDGFNLPKIHPGGNHTAINYGYPLIRMLRTQGGIMLVRPIDVGPIPPIYGRSLGIIPSFHTQILFALAISKPLADPGS